MRADVRTEVTAAALTEMFYEQDRMAATLPSEEELSRAKRYQAGLYLLRNQIQGAVAQTLASNWVNGLPPGALGEFVTKVNAVTGEQVREAGRTFYPSARQTVVVVGDEAKVKAELAQFGEPAVVAALSLRPGRLVLGFPATCRLIGVVIGFVAWFLVRYLLAGLFTVDQNERAVKTRFGRAQRIEGRTTLDTPLAEHLRKDERSRYALPAGAW